MLSPVSPAASYRQEKASEARWVPFETASPSAIPIVLAELNGGQAYRMGIDLSVSEALLDEFIVVGSGMELVSRGETQEIDYYGSKETVPVAYLGSLKLGGAEKRAVKTLIIRGDDLGAATGIPVYGKIGRNFLDGLRMTVYYPRKLLLVEPSPEDQIPEGGVAFRFEERGVSVEVLINDSHAGRFIVDPAASFSVLDEAWARKRGLAAKGDHRVDLDSLRVGSFLARDVPALVENTKKLSYEGRPAGIIGASLIREVAVTYDFARGLLWLRSVEGEVERPPP